MKFNKAVEAARLKRDALERPRESSLRTQFLESSSILVAQFARLLRREYLRHHPATQAANAKACRLPRAKDHEFDRTSWHEAKLLKRENSLQAAEHAHASVIQSSIRNGIDMRARSNGRKLRIGAFPACKRVADRILTHRQAGIHA